MANNYKRWLSEESFKTPSSRPTLIHFEFRSKPSLITVICMNPHSPNKFNLLRQNIVFSYSERIPVSFSWLFHYFRFFLLFYVIINFYFYYIFFSLKLFLFFHVPECSVFRVLSTMPSEIGLSALTSNAFLNQKPNKQTSHE